MSRLTAKDKLELRKASRRKLRRVLAWGALTLVALLALGFVAVLLLAPGAWRAYTNGMGISFRDGQALRRDVFWERPVPAPGEVNAANTRNSAPAVSADGQTMVFARSVEGGPADLYESHWNGRMWSAPTPLAGLNSPDAESAPALSRDGRYLYFHSDRRGGFGGYDLYVAFKLDGRWSKPMNVGASVNSEFDEVDPSLTYDNAKLFFASDRPADPSVDPETRRRVWEASRKNPATADLDIYAVDANLPGGDNPLADVKFREKVVTSLGGSPETEKAVVAALDWLTRNQEPDGRWDSRRHGGQCSDDAVTAFAMLCYMGWGAKHTEAGKYQQPLAKAVAWTLANEPKDGDWTRGTGSGNGMYCHGVMTTALAEAYTLTKDPALLGPLQRAVAVTVKAQSTNGGWRYTSQPTDADTSVVGWQMMALASARMAGVSIPETVFDGARRWLNTAGGGKHRGLYGYTGPGPAPALVGEGMFCQQLLGLSPSDPRQEESANYLLNSVTPGANEYQLYYGTLAAYQHQGALWKKWNPAMKEYLLKCQETQGANAGSWSVGGTTYGGHGGRVYTTSMAALTLEVYYRLLPMYNLPGGQEALARTTEERVQIRETDVHPGETPPLTATRIDALCSMARDRSPVFTSEGDFVYFSSDRPGGKGGFDIYRARLVYDDIRPVENVGYPINNAGDQLDPTLWSYGFAMALTSTGDSLEGLKGRQVFQSVARELYPIEDFKFIDWLMALLRDIFWWLLAGLAALIALIWLLYMLFGPRRDELGLLAKCLIGSVVLHLLLLALLSIWMMSKVILEQAGVDAMSVSVDAGALSAEKLAMEIREHVSDLENANSKMELDQQLLPAPDDVPMETPAAAMAEAFSKVAPASIDVVVPQTDAPQVDTPVKSMVDLKQVTQVQFKPREVVMEVVEPRQVQAEASPAQGVTSGVTAAARFAARTSDAPQATGKTQAETAAEVSQALGQSTAEAASASAGGPAGETLVAATVGQTLASQGGGMPNFSGTSISMEVPQRPGDRGDNEAAVEVGAPGTAAGPTVHASRGTPSPAAGQGHAANAGAVQSRSLVSGAARSGTVGVNVPGEALGASGEIGKAVAAGVPSFGPAGPQMEGAPARPGKGTPEASVNIGAAATSAKGVPGPREISGGQAGPVTRKVGPAEGGVRPLGRAGETLSGGLGQDANVPQLARLTGPGSEIVQRIPMYRIGGAPKFEERGKSVSPHLLRDPKLRKGLLKGLGGSEKTEAGVARALNWFTANQEPDGFWDARKHGGGCSNDATTAFAMLCYMGWGAKHTEPGRHQKPLAKAVEWMLKNEPKDGDWTRGTGSGNGMYTHGAVTVALCEAYGLTKDPTLLEPCKRALAVILKAQNKQHGGWRYTSKPSDGDTSVVGWQVMALESGRMAGIEIPEEPFELARKWLDLVGGGKEGGLYGYTGKSPSPAMVAEGMFCQQLMGLPPSLPRMRESATYLVPQVPGKSQRNFYAWYYGTLAAYQHQGELWDAWNPAMQKDLLGTQNTSGPNAGSWDPNGPYGSHGGRVISTAMSTLSLEVYYRYLPMYQSAPVSDDETGKTDPKP